MIKMLFKKVFFIIFCLNEVFCATDWIETSRELKEDIYKWYRRKIPRSDECISVGPRTSSVLDFPGDNKNKTIIIQKIWKNYYKCLKDKSQVIKNYGILPPYTVATIVGSSIQLDCNVCLSPEDVSFVPQWYHIKNIPELEEVLVEEDDHRQISAYTFALHFYNTQIEHQGLYYCKLETDTDATHILHVFKSELEPVKEVKPISSRMGPYARKPVSIIGTQMAIWNDWTSWTECSVCGKVGRRSRIGFCKISLRKYLSSEVLSNLEPEVLEEIFKISASIIKESESLLGKFINGVPCRSLLLRKELRETVLIRSFPTQVETGLCKVSCAPSVIVEVLNKNGSVVETYNNTAGDYYALQELPILPLGTKSVSFYANQGQPFFLTCPSKRDSNVPVVWSVNGKIWLKETVESLSNQRITINNLNEIVFRTVQDVDVKTYSCWQDKALVGVVRLRLNKKPSFIEEYSLTLKLYPAFMFVAIITTLSYIIVRMGLNGRKARAAAVQGKKRKRKSVELVQDVYEDKYLKEERYL